MNAPARSTLVVHLSNLSLVYWMAQCALGLIAMSQGTFRPLVFLAASAVGAFPVLALAHALFLRRAAGIERKAWGLRCAAALFLQLVAATFAFYEPGTPAAVLWAATTVLLTFVIYVSRHFVLKAV